MREVSRQIYFEPIIVSGALERNDFRAAIDVTLDKMAAQRRAGSERSLEIYRTVAAELFQICAVERFFKKIECQLIITLSADGESATVHGNAVPDRSCRRELRPAQLQLSATVGHADPKHATNFFN